MTLSAQEKIALINLLSVDGIGSATAIRLVQACGTPSAVFNAPVSVIRAIPRIHDASIDKLRAAKPDADAGKKIMDRADAEGVEIRTYWDDSYPMELKQLDTDAPATLYIKGLLPDFARRIAVVGTRRASNYGSRATKEMIEGLRNRDIVIVSGLAAGIDGYAHSAALECGLRTEAVFGCGLDIISPASHKNLAAKIVESGGALVSEYPFGFPADVNTFPARNRIIAGLSRITLVVEAPARSGALITARLAIEYGRDVGAVPGPIQGENSRGCHDLIKTGAALVESADDILTMLRMNSPAQKSVETIQLPLDLPQVEMEIMKLLHVTEAVHIDSIAEKTGITMGEALSRSLMLELKGLIKQLPGKYFVRS